MSSPEVPGDLAVALERDDVDGHVVLAEREVVERLPVHVDDERVADLLGGLTGEALQHPGRVDGDVACRAAHDVEDGRGGAGIGRVTSMRLGRKTVSGTVVLLAGEARSSWVAAISMRAQGRSADARSEGGLERDRLWPSGRDDHRLVDERLAVDDERLPTFDDLSLHGRPGRPRGPRRRRDPSGSG